MSNQPQEYVTIAEKIIIPAIKQIADPEQIIDLIKNFKELNDYQNIIKHIVKNPNIKSMLIEYFLKCDTSIQEKMLEIFINLLINDGNVKYSIGSASDKMPGVIIDEGNKEVKTSTKAAEQSSNAVEDVFSDKVAEDISNAGANDTSNKSSERSLNDESDDTSHKIVDGSSNGIVKKSTASLSSDEEAAAKKSPNTNQSWADKVVSQSENTKASVDAPKRNKILSAKCFMNVGKDFEFIENTPLYKLDDGTDKKIIAVKSFLERFLEVYYKDENGVDIYGKHTIDNLQIQNVRSNTYVYNVEFELNYPENSPIMISHNKDPCITAKNVGGIDVDKLKLGEDAYYALSLDGEMHSQLFLNSYRYVVIREDKRKHNSK
tara:strand:+ start:57 stop:1184 length:1128 start_codon:yes stop_codon:yes gene_type:complete